MKSSVDFDFEGHNTLYATHGLHAFAAKCPPQLVQYGLEKFTKPGEIVFDPMAGSGTVLVESRLHGRNAIGCDIDPLSCLISRVKSQEIEDQILLDAFNTVSSSVSNDLLSFEAGKIDLALIERMTGPEFHNRDYWFNQSTQEKLALLTYHISNQKIDLKARDFLWLVFSSVILSKVSVANARDIIHSRHHFYSHPNPIDPIKRFKDRFTVMRRQMADYWSRCKEASTSSVNVFQGDARSLALSDESIDLVFTSPPYATALDYPRAHFLAVAWMQRVLGVDLQTYMRKGEEYIGTERGHSQANFSIDQELARFASISSFINQLSNIDGRKAFLIHRYFSDMRLSLYEMARVLKKKKFAIIVVCPSHIRKLEIPTHKAFTEMFQEMGLYLENEYTRTISDRRRVLPYMLDSFGERMSTEYVLIYQKK